ncbi:hypothetical protein TWF706_000325, partial [Orbilia oligospora]
MGDGDDNLSSLLSPPLLFLTPGWWFLFPGSLKIDDDDSADPLDAIRGSDLSSLCTP